MEHHPDIDDAVAHASALNAHAKGSTATTNRDSIHRTQKAIPLAAGILALPLVGALLAGSSVSAVIPALLAAVLGTALVATKAGNERT